MWSLTKHLEANNLLDGCQYDDFHHGRSTFTNLLKCNACIVEYLNANTACDVKAFDFSRAFDKVNHHIFCNKLKSIGVDGSYLRWIVDYLCDGKQFITHNKAHSILYDTSFGIVQVVSGGFFTIFIDDHCVVIKFDKTSLFTDDF